MMSRPLLTGKVSPSQRTVSPPSTLSDERDESQTAQVRPATARSVQKLANAVKLFARRKTPGASGPRRSADRRMRQEAANSEAKQDAASSGS